MLRKILGSKAIKTTESAVSKTIQSFNHSVGLSPVKVDRLKQAVEVHEKSFNFAKQELASHRRGYEKAVTNRSKVQAEINSLLQRKQDWNNNDLSRCTECYQKEHTLTILEEEAKLACAKQEQKVELMQNQFLGALRSVYQEETALSQRAKILSSYFTWGLIFLNSSIFLVSTLLIEPKKREQGEIRLKKMIREENSQRQNQTIGTLGEIKKSLTDLCIAQTKIVPTEWDSSEEEEIGISSSALDFEKYQPQAVAFFIGGAVTYFVLTLPSP